MSATDTQTAILANPTLSWSALTRREPAYAGSVLEGRRAWLVTSGRIALAHALHAWGVRPGDEILVPAYHCLAMITPIDWLGARPVFYPIRADFTMDETALAAQVTARTRAIVVVHYFGFATPLDAVRSLCDRNGLALVEDCAHAFYTHTSGGAVGGIGDYAIASPMKFLPLFDGGALVARPQAPGPRVPLAGAGALYELKALVDVLERASEAQSLPGLNALIRAATRVKRLWRRRPSVAVPAAAVGSFGFDSNWLNVRPSVLSRTLIAAADRRRITEARRRVYEELAGRLSDAPSVVLPFPDLDPAAVPYVLPLLCDDGDSLFRRAREVGVQVLRWEFTETQDCSTTRRYARSLLQFPCHQTLTSADIDRIVALVRRVAIE